MLFEEQEKILNNLNLNGIGDEEVIKLYSQVLDEIGQIELADREVVMLQDRYRRAIHRQMGTTAFVTAAHMATGSMDGMVRTGVNSWLDYRDMTFARELDAFKVEKTRMTAVVDKSSKFLDTFWKLGQSRNIPDSWLIRGNDLDELEEAVREPDLEKRMRVLRRMEGFMECYPPYWYFVARTEQGLGRLPQAGKTFEKVVDLAHGHFRRDDMLAAAMANRALILDVLKQPHADRVAKAALGYSNSVWEANLIAAQVLERHGRAHEAEDAILRNLDSDLEKSSSAVALLGLYFRQNRNRELAGLLASGELLKEIPVLSLVQCLQRLGSDTPPAVSQHLRESLRVAVEPRFGADDLLLIAEPGWSVELASVRLFLPGTVLDGPGVGAGQREVMKPSPAGLPGSSSLTTTGTSQAASSSPGTSASLGPSAFVRFSGAVDAGGPFSSSNPLLDGSVALIDFRGRLPETQPLVVVFGPALAAAGGNSATAPWWTAASPVELRYGARRFDLTGQGLAADPLAGRWPASSPTGLPSPPTAASPVVASPTAASLTAPAVPAPAQPRGSLLPGPEVVRLPSAAGPYAAAFLPSTPAPGAGPLRATILGIRGVSVASPAARQDAPPARRKPSTPSLLPFFPPGQVSPKWTEVEPSAPQTPSPPVD